jgi:glycosyltransferase involved in cell wall biosynthesis
VFSALDVCCLSSISEGFPNVLAEAMLCGVPCVSTDVGDARQILGPFGAVVPPRVETAFADAIERVAAAPHDRAALRARIVDNFSIPKLARATLDALGGIVAGRA